MIARRSTRCWRDARRGPAGARRRAGRDRRAAERRQIELFNALAGAGRAIVTDIPGTTRDLLTERVDIDGIADHARRHRRASRAGRRMPSKPKASRARAPRPQRADLPFVVLDRSRPLDRRRSRAARDDRRRRARRRGEQVGSAARHGRDAIGDGSLSSVGDDRRRHSTTLRRRDRCGARRSRAHRDTPAITNVRHVDLLERARVALCARARRRARTRTPEEFVAADVGEARATLEEITGARTPTMCCTRSSSRFCIGK